MLIYGTRIVHFTADATVPCTFGTLKHQDGWRCNNNFMNGGVGVCVNCDGVPGCSCSVSAQLSRDQDTVMRSRIQLCFIACPPVQPCEDGPTSFQRCPTGYACSNKDQWGWGSCAKA